MDPRRLALDLVRTWYARFDAGDREGMLALLAPDVRHDINQGACEIGVPAFRAFLAHMDRCYRERTAGLVAMADESGTRAAAEFEILGTYLADDAGLPPARGQEYRLPVAATFAIAGGRIARISTWYNLREWLRQVTR